MALPRLNIEEVLAHLEQILNADGTFQTPIPSQMKHLCHANEIEHLGNLLVGYADMLKYLSKVYNVVESLHKNPSILEYRKRKGLSPTHQSVSFPSAKKKKTVLRLPIPGPALKVVSNPLPTVVEEQTMPPTPSAPDCPMTPLCPLTPVDPPILIRQSGIQFYDGPPAKDPMRRILEESFGDAFCHSQ